MASRSRQAGDDRSPITRDQVVDAAIELLTDRGVDDLTMRSLAAAVGAAPTAIYWHVGDKEAVLDAVADRVAVDISHLEPEGESLTERIVSIGTKLRAYLRDSARLVGIAHRRGRTAQLFHPARAMVVRELIDADVAADRAALITEAVMYVVSGSVLTDIQVDRSAPERVTAAELWQPSEVEGAADPAKLLAALATLTPSDDLFTRTLTAMLNGLL